jgi:hypothetical protein
VLGWGAVGGCLLLALAGKSLFSRPVQVPEPTAEEVAALARLPESQRPAALTNLATRLAREDRDCQVLIVQSVPGQTPLVLTNTVDTDGDEEPTHWPAPWPAVAEALKQPLDGPRVITGSYAGVAYRHRLIPLDSAGSRCLLINTAAAEPRWVGVRGGLVVAAIAAGCLLARFV